LSTYRSSRLCARFDQFQVDLTSGHLIRSGVRVAIQDKPLQVLRLLLEAEGGVVTRESLRTALWPKDTFVDFEHGVNTAVKKLRQALEDSAESPAFVETLPKIGYRFLLPVEWVPDATNKSSSPRVVAIAPAGPTAVPLSAASQEDRRPGHKRWLIATVVLVLLVAGVVLYLMRTVSRAQPETLTITPFTTFPGFEIAPSFSPDGNQIVFSWFGYEKEFQFDLYVKQVGQERAVQLTHHPATFLVSAWSPDGRFIAFMRQAEPEATGVYLISSLGGAERKLADISPFDGWDPIALSWSPDAKWVAFSKGSSGAGKTGSSPKHFSIHLVNSETTEERALPDPSPDCANIWQPAFSPDGRYIASVCVLTGGVAKIYLQTPEGKQAHEVEGARALENFAGIAWATDSQSLLYSADMHLWRVPVDGGKPEKLLFAQDVETVAVARTGNRLAYAQVRHNPNIWQLEIARETKAAGPATKLISSSRGDAGPHISPDGKHLAFQSARSGSWEMWVTDRDGSNPVQLSSFGGPQVGTPSWAPDSRRIVFDVRASGKAELYVVNLEGRPPKRFPTGTASASNPFWSADGRWIYFSTERPDIIWKAPVEGGASVRLIEGEGKIWPQASVDGKRLFFYKMINGHSESWSASVNGGDEQPVAGMPKDTTWAPGQNGIYFVSGYPRHFSLSYYNFGTRGIHKIANLPGLFFVQGATISPDGRTFLFFGIEHSEGDIMLAEGFR
jgi:Tol biopolymer transport system component